MSKIVDRPNDESLVLVRRTPEAALELLKIAALEYAELNRQTVRKQPILTAQAKLCMAAVTYQAALEYAASSAAPAVARNRNVLTDEEDP